MEFSIRVLGGTFRAAARIACFGYVLKGRAKMKVFHVAAKGLGPVLALILGSVGLLSSGCAPAGPGFYPAGGQQGLGEFEGQQIDKKLAALDLDESQFAVSEVSRDRLRGRVQERYSIEFEKGWGHVKFQHLIGGNFRPKRNVADGAEVLSAYYDVTIVSQDVKVIPRGGLAPFYVAFLTEQVVVSVNHHVVSGQPAEESYCGYFIADFQNAMFSVLGYLCRTQPLTEKVKAEHRTHVEDFLFRMEKH